MNQYHNGQRNKLYNSGVNIVIPNESQKLVKTITSNSRQSYQPRIFKNDKIKFKFPSLQQYYIDEFRNLQIHANQYKNIQEIDDFKEQIKRRQSIHTPIHHHKNNHTMVTQTFVETLQNNDKSHYSKNLLPEKAKHKYMDKIFIIPAVTAIIIFFIGLILLNK